MSDITVEGVNAILHLFWNIAFIYIIIGAATLTLGFMAKLAFFKKPCSPEDFEKATRRIED